MRKLYALVVSALMLLPTASFAQTMTEENPVLDQWGYRLEKDVNFNEGTVNGKEIIPSEDLQFGGDDDFKINGNVMTKVTNEGLEFLSVHTMKDQMHLVPGEGLKSTGNERWIAIKNLREGQILAFDISNADTTQFVVNSNACNGNTGWADTFVDPLIVEPISGSVHELQEIAEEGSADPFRYFKVINEGTMYAKFNGKTANIIYRFQIWSDKNDAEAVTTPTLKMVAVDQDVRRFAFKPGESTLGNEVVTYYTTNGDDPVYLKDSEVIDHYEYIYEEDEEGNQIVTDSTAVYKKVLDADKVAAEGYYGDGELFDPELEYIQVDHNDDEDDGNPDGFVTIKAVSVSEASGAISAVVEQRVSVGVIDLNAPVLSLVGFNGEERAYAVSWTNNTLCGEDYAVIVKNENGVIFDGTEEPNTGLGESFTATDNIEVTIRVKGYTDGVTALDELDAAGIDVNRKADLGNAQNEDHNWDFQNLTEDVIAKIDGIIDHYAIIDDEGNEIQTFTVEQYENDETPEDITDALEAVINHDYGWDALDTRAEGRHWRTEVVTFEPDTLLDAEGNDSIVSVRVSAVYAEDKTGLFDGLDVDNSHDNYSTLAIFTNGKGLYFMSRGSIVVKSVAYGEYVLVNTSAGVTVVQKTEPGDVTLSIGNGVYVYSIDVFTYDNLPEEPDAIASVATSAKVAAIYTVGGARVAAPQKGINIVKYADGSVKKVLVK